MRPDLPARPARILSATLLLSLLGACSSMEPVTEDHWISREAASPASQAVAVLPSDKLIHSRRLSPGMVSPRTIDMPGLRPVFLIGDDRLSRIWLKVRRERLQGINALGLVVNAVSSDSLATLQQLAPGLRLIPVSGDDLANLVGVYHYPVLVTSTYLEQ